MNMQYTQSDVLKWLDQSTVVLKDILGQSQSAPVISDSVRKDFFSKLKVVAGVVTFLAHQEKEGALTFRSEAKPAEEGRSERMERLAEIRSLALTVADILRSRMTLLN